MGNDCAGRNEDDRIHVERDGEESNLDAGRSMRAVTMTNLCCETRKFTSIGEGRRGGGYGNKISIRHFGRGVRFRWFGPWFGASSARLSIRFGKSMGRLFLVLE